MTRRTLLLFGAIAGLVAAAAYLGDRFPEAGAAEGEPSFAPAERVRVEVRNAGGVSGAAGDATDLLREHGFDVVQYGNASSFDRDTTVVVDRVGREDLAEAVANALGIRNVLVEPDSTLFVDVTVLLGRDWVVRAGDSEHHGQNPDRPAWDPRGWLGR